jgi:hypothetical protein
MKQKATDLEHKSGLSPFQEQVAALLSTGKTVTDTAAVLNVSRATIYRLLQDGLFTAYYNLLCQEVQVNLKNHLFTLQDKAFTALTSALDSDNAPTQLKAATWVLDKIQSVEVDNTDPKHALYLTSFPDDGGMVDVVKFERLKKQYGLE